MESRSVVFFFISPSVSPSISATKWLSASSSAIVSTTIPPTKARLVIWLVVLFLFFSVSLFCLVLHELLHHSHGHSHCLVLIPWFCNSSLSGHRRSIRRKKCLAV